jgi:DHA3 family macrolide efflux protein-like MFS transporter
MYVLKALRLPHVVIVILGQVLSSIGDNFFSIAVMWIAVKSAGSDAGLVAVAGTISVFFFGLLGGVYADRWNRRRTMIIVDVLRACIVLTLAGLSLSGLLQFWHLVAVSFLVGAAGALFDPALQSSVGTLAGNDQTLLQAINALLRLARAPGPILVGVLVIFLPLAHLFTLDAVSFGVSALSLLALGARFAWQPPQVERRVVGLRGVLGEAGEGVQVVLRSHGLRAALLSDLLSSFTWGVTWIVGVPLLVAHGLGNTVGAYGLIVGVYGVGNLISNLVVGSVRIRWPVFTMTLGRTILGCGYLMMAFAPNVPMALVASFIASFGGPLGDIPKSLMVLVLPPQQTGRVFGAFTTFEYVAYSLGLLLAVPLFALLDVRLGMALGAVLLIVTSLYGLVGAVVWPWRLATK